jgi:hypothetical protein
MFIAANGITVTGRKEIIATKLLTGIFSMDKVFYMYASGLLHDESPRIYGRSLSL